MKTAHQQRSGSYILGTLLIYLYLLFFGNTASAQLMNITANDTIQLWVTVANKTMVDIQPDTLAWQNVDPGSETLASQAVGFPVEAVQIENIGSTNISRIWFNNSYPAANPFGSGDPSDYDAGNFAIVRRNTSGSTFFFPNLVEYNESELIYLQLPTPSTQIAHGRFRSANKEWFWAINSSDGNCTNNQFRVGKTAHNQTQMGSADLRTCDPALSGAGALGVNPCRVGTLTPTTLSPYTGINQWGWADVYVGENAAYENYTVAVYGNCTDTVKVMLTHWNKDAPGAQEGAVHPEYFYNAPLAPGEHIIANVKLRIPYGTAAGNITGALTVTVQALNVMG